MSKYIEEKVNLLKKKGYEDILIKAKDGMGNEFDAVRTCARSCAACPYLLGYGLDTYCAVEAYANEDYGCCQEIKELD